MAYNGEGDKILRKAKFSALRSGLLVAIGIVSVLGMAGQAQAAPASTPSKVNSVQSYVTSVPAAAKALGLERKLSTWSLEGGVVHVGLTSVGFGDTAKFAAKLGSAVEVHQQDAFTSMVKKTPLSKMKDTVVEKGRPKPVLGSPTAASSTTATQSVPGNYPPYIDSLPYWGGDRITSIQGSYIFSCTVTGAYGSGAPYMMTAGHCGPAGVTWQQGYYDDATGSRYITGDMGTASNVQWGNNQIDGELLSGNSYGSNIWTSGSTALSVAGIGRVAVGASICTDGSFTGYRCGGTVASVNTCANIYEKPNTYVICGLDIANGPSRLVQAGDSGGPVLSEITSSSTKVAGTISAGNDTGTQVLFTDSGRQLDVFGLSPTS